MPATAERRAAELRSPVMIRFEADEEVGWLRESIEDFQTKCDEEFIASIGKLTDKDPDKIKAASRHRDKVGRFTMRILRMLDRKGNGAGSNGNGKA